MNSNFIALLHPDAESIAILDKIITSIDLYAELTGSDVFLDCFTDEKNALVIAHGRPKEHSLYHKNITGAKVAFGNEPMVFYTKQTGIPSKDARALSQENKMLLQKTIPIKKEDGTVIAVLIIEQDDTERYNLNTKLTHIKEATDKLVDTQLMDEEIANKSDSEYNENIFIQETHHRVKNNLQTISSILRMQQRRCKTKEAKSILTDDIGMINSLAGMYEMIMTSRGGQIDLYDSAKRLIDIASQIYSKEQPDVAVTLHGDHILVSYEAIQPLTLIINELIQNAYKHGCFRTRGEIRVHLMNGNRFGFLHVIDNGIGISPEENRTSHLGLSIIKILVKEKLNGEFSIQGNAAGTTACVQFPL